MNFTGGGKEENRKKNKKKHFSNTLALILEKQNIALHWSEWHAQPCTLHTHTLE